MPATFIAKGMKMGVGPVSAGGASPVTLPALGAGR
jgi:hypothetical protein